jgi:NAD(P)-dependent dehydrogenase (short-subunit alcohol dehydrogenase family)
MNIRDSVWFITGCSRGLGRDLATQVLAQGGKLAATARDVGALAQLAEGQDDRVLTLPLDMNEPRQIEQAVARAVEHFGRLDVIVNNAGYGYLGAVEEIDDAASRAQFDTNFFGPVHLIRTALPVLRRQKRGHIINVSSIGGFAALAGCGQYSATKFALEGLSEALQQEVAPLGIHVTVVEPNGFRTDFTSARSLQRATAVIPDYLGTSGATQARFAAVDGKQPSDPVKGALAIIKAVEAEQPPFRLPLGQAGVLRIREKLAQVEAELARWEALSNSVAFDE